MGTYCFYFEEIEDRFEEGEGGREGNGVKHDNGGWYTHLNIHGFHNSLQNDKKNYYNN